RDVAVKRVLQPYAVVVVGLCRRVGQLDCVGLEQLDSSRPIGILGDVVGDDLVALEKQADIEPAYHAAAKSEEILTYIAMHPDSDSGRRRAAGAGDRLLGAVQDHETR